MNNSNCPIAETIKLLQGKWKGVIVFMLAQHQPCRFGQLQRLVPGCSKRLLAIQLKELENKQVVAKKTYPTMPPKTEYTLTTVGESLIPVLKAMNQRLKS